MIEAMIELWLVDLEACSAALEALERDTPRLADDDRDRAGAVADARERRHRLAAYTALRVLLERAAGPGVRGKPLPRAPGGKPGLGESGVDYSLSHTQGLALVGVSRGTGSIGVDLERARPVKMSPRAYTEICAIGAGLGGRLLPGPGTDRAFLQAWARLEAFSKARGRGLARTLTDLGQRGTGRLRQLPPGQIEAAARRLALDAGFSVRDLGLPPGLHGALAAPRGVPPARPRAFPSDRPGIERLLEQRP
jgi:4'-phosphopantetheinyl transferase